MKNVNIYEDKTWIRKKVMRPGGMELTQQLTQSLTTRDYILDLGSGEGATVDDLMQKGLHVIGIDVSKSLTELAKKTYKDSTFYHGDGQRLPFLNEQFTAVLCECSLSAMENLDVILSEINRVMKPAGSLLVSDLYRKPKVGKEKGAILNLNEWERLFTSKGFQDIKIKVCDQELHKFILQSIWNEEEQSLIDCIGTEYRSKDLGYATMIAVKK